MTFWMTSSKPTKITLSYHSERNVQENMLIFSFNIFYVDSLTLGHLQARGWERSGSVNIRDDIPTYSAWWRHCNLIIIQRLRYILNCNSDIINQGDHICLQRSMVWIGTTDQYHTTNGHHRFKHRDVYRRFYILGKRFFAFLFHCQTKSEALSAPIIIAQKGMVRKLHCKSMYEC